MRAGRYNLCPTHGQRALGITADGGMAEQFRAPSARLVALPPGLDVQDASIVEPASVSWPALRIARAGPNTRVAVVGAGALGLLAVAGTSGRLGNGRRPGGPSRRSPTLAEVDSLIERGARIVHVRPAPVPGPNGTSRSLGDRSHDRNVWVTPYYEEDLGALAELMGLERILFGSDWPHGEGLAEPTDFAKELDGFNAAEVRKIMRDNCLELLDVQAPVEV